MKPFVRIAACIALMLAGAAIAAERHETRAVSGFHALSLSAPIKVELVQGDAEGMTLDGDEAALAEIETVVENGTLRIRNRNHSGFWSSGPDMSRVVAHVSAKAIDALSTAGSGDIRSASINSKGLNISIAGSGDVRIETLATSGLHVSIAGSGNVVVAGKADSVQISIAGSGDMKASRLESRESSVSIAGSGDAMLWVRDSIHVSIMGSGDVRYFGDPSVSKSVLGSGSIKRVAASPS